MLIDWLLELKNSVDRHGIRWGIALTLYALFRKEHRNIRLDQRDADIFHNQRVIMDKLGAVDQWRGQVTPYQSQEAKSLEILWKSSQGAIKQVHQKRRKKKMNALKSTKFWLAIIGAIIPVINNELGINLDSNTILGILGLFATAIAGIAHVDAKKAQNVGTVSEPAKPTGDSGQAV